MLTIPQLAAGIDNATLSVTDYFKVMPQITAPVVVDFAQEGDDLCQEVWDGFKTTLRQVFRDLGAHWSGDDDGLGVTVELVGLEAPLEMRDALPNVLGLHLVRYEVDGQKRMAFCMRGWLGGQDVEMSVFRFLEALNVDPQVVQVVKDQAVRVNRYLKGVGHSQLERKAALEDADPDNWSVTVLDDDEGTLVFRHDNGWGFLESAMHNLPPQIQALAGAYL